MPIGTTDFLIEAGNRLANLGYEFTITAKERYNKAPWVCLCNVSKVEVGKEMLETLNYTLKSRFQDGQP